MVAESQNSLNVGRKSRRIFSNGVQYDTKAMNLSLYNGILK